MPEPQDACEERVASVRQRVPRDGVDPEEVKGGVQVIGRETSVPDYDDDAAIKRCRKKR